MTPCCRARAAKPNADPSQAGAEQQHRGRLRHRGERVLVVEERTVRLEKRPSRPVPEPYSECLNRRASIKKALNRTMTWSTEGRFYWKMLVGARGSQPPTPRSRTECSTRLSHAPTKT